MKIIVTYKNVYVWMYMMDKCIRESAMYSAQIRVDSLSLNDCADHPCKKLHCVIALSVTSSGMNCVQVHYFRCKQTRTRDPRLSRHVSRGVNCHPQHASVTCPLSARASERTSERAVPF